MTAPIAHSDSSHVALRQGEKRGKWGIATSPKKFKEAIKAFRERVPMSDDTFEALDARAKQKAFRVAGVAQLDVVTHVWRLIDRAIATGQSLEDFKAEATDRLKRAWGGSVENPPARVETIFRTNVQSAFSAGRWAQMTDPEVLEVQTHWMFDAILDDATTEVCSECDGTILPASSAWWATHNPPLHFNAVTADTPITTDRGDIPARDVRPGDLVITHRGRWRRVTACLHKLVENRAVRELRLSSGRSLRVTHEHPILRAAPETWRVAGDVHAGDEVFERRPELPGALRGAIRYPENAPPLLDEPPIAREVVGLSRRRPVTLSVDLDGNTIVRECEVRDEGTDRELSNSAEGGEDREKVTLRWGEFLAQYVCARCGGASRHAGDARRVPGAHGLDTIGTSAAEGPVPVAARPIDGAIRVQDCDLLGLRAHNDPVALAPPGDDAIANGELALDRADASTARPVLLANERLAFAPIGEVDCLHRSTVITTVDARYSGELCDFSVEEDETYFAAGVLVHNCRSGIITLTESEAGKEGISKSAPRIDAASGFGLSPADSDWQPSAADYPDELWNAKEIP